MEYGIDIRFFTEFGIRKAAEIAAKAGFTQLDYTGPVWEDDWKQQIKEAYAIFQDLGLNVHQAHQGTDAALLHGGTEDARELKTLIESFHSESAAGGGLYQPVFQGRAACVDIGRETGIM